MWGKRKEELIHIASPSLKWNQRKKRVDEIEKKNKNEKRKR